jgi:hypothetical protein
MQTTNITTIKLLKDIYYRKLIINDMCRGITNTSDFIDALDYVIDKMVGGFFNIHEFEKMYDEDVIPLIIPSFRRVWAKIYIDIPPIYKPPKEQGLHPKTIKKLELYQSLFNIDEFLIYLREMFLKSKNCLNEFEHLDRTNEHLTLVVDNYVAMLIQKTNETKDITQDIRDAKINKLL